ncbi:MAG: methionyl-tRNA formyltransferase [Rhodospirillales bacterium]|nr:methionyl-tRNA formyltransferase [Rhodospirillales bacterium]
MSALRLIFMGTPDFSVPVLERLIAAGHDIVCVYSQPPRPAGRGQKQTPTPVHACAERHGIEVRTPKSFAADDVRRDFLSLNADAAVVVAYGLILPKLVLAGPRLGCINIHASLLPRWRGAAPIQRAIMAGDTQSGITIMQMDEGLDTGDILAMEKIELPPDITATELHDQLSTIGADLIVATLDDVAAERITPLSQPSAGAIYAAKIDKAEGRIDWRKPASAIDRLVRALTPWPGVWFVHDGERIKIFNLSVVDDGSGAKPGTVLDNHLKIACGDGAVVINELQRPGKKRAASAEVLRGYTIAAGTLLAG